MKGVIDFHAHAFPDRLAEYAIAKLEAETDEATACLDGRVASLLASMDLAGIEQSVICSIATKPEQFEPILAWSGQIASARIVPFPSVHPRDPAALERLGVVRREGFPGIKLHPYYQDFTVDDASLLPFYRRASELGLMVVFHTGFDIAFPRVRIADPARLAWLHRQVPGLAIITTHLGAWEDWDAVREHLLGETVYMEVSFTDGYLTDNEIRDMLQRHPRDYVLFGTDSPWRDQSEALAAVRRLELEPALEQALLVGNATRLLCRHQALP